MHPPAKESGSHLAGHSLAVSGELAQPSKTIQLSKGRAKIAAWFLLQAYATLLELALVGRVMLMCCRIIVHAVAEWTHHCLISGGYRRERIVCVATTYQM